MSNESIYDLFAYELAAECIREHNKPVDEDLLEEAVDKAIEMFKEHQNALRCMADANILYKIIKIGRQNDNIKKQ